MELENVSCYLCGSSESSVWGKENGFTMTRCSSCGLLYLNPRPTLGSIDESARTGLHKTGPGNLVALGRHSRARARDYISKLSEVFPDEELHRGDVCWLDIGAGYGELLEALRKVSGPEANLKGIEPCQPKVHDAQRMGLPVETKSLAEVTQRFTHVSLVNVFSHLPDPISFLSDLRRLLLPNGELLLVTGNAGDIRRDQFPGALYLPDHLSFASEQNLRTIVDKAGFALTAIHSFPAGASLDGPVVTLAKNMVRCALGRAPLVYSVSDDSPFRTLWVRASLRPDP